ncbi:TspO/MBR family protein [Streptomyces sp. NPDC015492]|uniref:TspO/MBR family protein n=1 Tax=Streptomyces sp. NPDC015492 TaxID=3364958 RepID=UPI003701114B
MRLISEGHRSDAAVARRWPRYCGAAVAVAAAAAAGARSVDPDSAWYRALRKPPWQPPAWAFGAVWTPLYASLAFAGGHALGGDEGQGRSIAARFGVNLALNAGWTWLFFGRHSPRAALAGTVLLDLSNAELIRRLARTDRVAARALVPYALWCAFATALNTSIARRNL